MFLKISYLPTFSPLCSLLNISVLMFLLVLRIIKHTTTWNKKSYMFKFIYWLRTINHPKTMKPIILHVQVDIPPVYSAYLIPHSPHPHNLSYMAGTSALSTGLATLPLYWCVTPAQSQICRHAGTENHLLKALFCLWI